MNRDQFFLGFFAALRGEDLDFIDTRHDRHHARFRRAARRLKEAREAGRPGASDMPRALVPSPYNARFKEFDQALIRLQKGDLGANNPYYPGISLVMDKRRANQILERFPPDAQTLFRELAAEYLAAASDDERVERVA
jgi:hypothetical protein